MADNLFTDLPQRKEQLLKYSGLQELIEPLEECFGEKGFFKNNDEALDFYWSALDEIGKMAAREVAPKAAEVDREGCRLVEGEVKHPEALLHNLRRCAELGIFSGPMPRKFGGLNLPRAIQMMALEMLAHACPNTGLTAAVFSMAEWFEEFASDAQKEKYLEKLMTNEWQTSMALTESGAGSDLGKLRSTGTKRGEEWLVNGTKQFITNGDGQLTFALVRTDPKSTGLSGLSVIMIQRRLDGKENFKVSKIEDKVCLHGSPTCELVFEDSVGELLGVEGQGFKVMSELMNIARHAMGTLALGIAQSAVEETKKYAATRMTMGKPIIQHPMIADMIYEAEIEIRAMRALCAEVARAYDWMRIERKRGNEKEFKRWKKRYRRLTPLIKYMGSEKAITIAKNCVQIFGGYGVCREYPVERMWRETIIYPIYEGASQIQSLMVLKDTLKDVASQATGFLGSLAGAWAESMVARNAVKSQVLQARNELNQGIKTILSNIIKNKFKSDIESIKQTNIQAFLKEFSLKLLSEKTDLTFPFLVAERFTKITCDYYALKSMADNYTPGDKEREKWILEFAAIALPRMRLENHYMANRLPSTLDYLKTIS